MNLGDHIVIGICSTSGENQVEVQVEIEIKHFSKSKSVIFNLYLVLGILLFWGFVCFTIGVSILDNMLQDILHFCFLSNADSLDDVYIFFFSSFTSINNVSSFHF